MTPPRPSWLRRLRRTCLFLLTGFTTTIGVAWGLAALFDGTRGMADDGWYDYHEQGYVGPGTVHRLWSVGLADTPGVVLDGYNSSVALAWSVGGRDAWGDMAAEGRRWSEQLAEAQEAGSQHPSPAWGVEEARGWPALALWCRVEDVESLSRDVASLGRATPPDLYGAIPPPLPTRSIADTAFRALPLLPIWPGLAFDTAFYALLWWLGFSSVRMVRHNRRHKQGLCPVCRYDLKADYSHGCPECGWGRKNHA